MSLRDKHIAQFNIVFDQYFTALCYFAEKIIKSRDEAKDIVVVSFQKYWEKRDNFIEQSQIKSFLYLVTRNACFDFLRHRNLTSSYQNAFFDVSSSSAEADADQLITETETLGKIYLEATRLPKKCRQVFELTYYEELNTSQIAERLKMTVSNVTSQRSRAIRLLRMALMDKDLIMFFLIFSALPR